MTTVLIVEADPELRALLQLLLELAPDVRVSGALGGVREAVTACQQARPDVLIVDAEILHRAALTPYWLSQQLPGTSVLVLALYPADTVDAMRGDSTVGFLAKDSPLSEMTTAIHRLALASAAAHLPTAPGG